ncbi:MAG: signal recognition particle-docking protein FtsY [Nitrospinota bacterium]
MGFGFGKNENDKPSELIGEKEKGFFGRLRRGLAKTRESFVARIESALVGRTRFDLETIDEIEEVLYMADIGPGAVETVLDRLRRGEGKRETPAERIQSILLDLIERPAADPPAAPADPPPGEPRVILLAGVNGAGKTTTAGKIAARLAAEGQIVVFAAADTFRAAAGEQAEVWAERAGCQIVRHKEGADPGAVVFDAIAAARARGAGVLLVDTAGRLHTQQNLMDELVKIRRVAAGQIPGAPHEVLLVLDATSGQNALAQVARFGPALGVTGLVITKLDGSAKGGVLIGAVHQSGIPVRWIGVGEGIADLLPFDANAFTAALFGESAS